jgi:antitoxin YefM
MHAQEKGGAMAQTEELTITEARKRLLDLPNHAGRVVKVTRRGRPALAILAWEQYESILETLEVLSDPELMGALREGIADIQHGKVVAQEEVRARLAR